MALLVEEFEVSIPDEKWLPEAGRRGWAVLTKDRMLSRKELQRELMMRSGVGAFILTSANLRGVDMAEAFARALPTMLRIWRTRSRPFIATVTASGAVTIKFGGARRGGVRKR